jgi:ssDNA-binding Zn-finger/Zn-ribbon topoisomerase 1
MEKKVSLHVKCPLCGKSLMDDEVILNGKPSVKVNIISEKDRGVLHLCSTYGCELKKMEVQVGPHEVVEFYCPHCNKDLSTNEHCTVCEAPMVSFFIKAGGEVRICSRNGCLNHHIVFKDISSELSKFYYEYGF